MKARKMVYVLLALVVIVLISILMVNQKWRAARFEAERAAELEKAGTQARQDAGPITTPSRSSTAWRPAGKQWQDPEAREALRLVGADAAAEQYWALAINNPDLPAKERQDLIEDLNEEGYADLKNLTPEDIELVKNRIRIIEQLAPQAMDQVNAAAFKEAYKDLTNMLARATR